jgi:inosine-uridine nucleoside N-ribohydrolase
MKRYGILLLIMLFFACQSAVGQASKYFGVKQSVPEIPPKGKRIKVILVSDAANEIDDVWAIALAILFPERLDIVGFVGSNFDHTYTGEGPESIKESVEVINTILEKAGMKGQFPVYPGANPMQYEFYPSGSEGADFIIQEAMASSPENPLWIICLGAPTDPASAYLKQPEIKDRVVMFWHARTEETWPYRAHNYNIKGDMHASRMMFHAPFPLVLFDTGTQLYAGTLEESEKNVKPFGALGDYLYDYRLKSDYFKSPTKGYFDMGDIAVLIDPDLGRWEVTPCPTVTPYMDYNFYKTNGRVLRCYGIDRDKTFELLYNGLKARYGVTR